jgi:hypothetical protein
MADVIALQYKMVRKLYLRGFDFLSNPIRCALIDQSYTFDVTHQTWGQISSYEIAQGSGYTTGGILLANRVLVEEAERSYITADNLEWTVSGTLSAWGVVFYAEGTFLGYTNPLLAYERYEPKQIVSSTGMPMVISLPNNEFMSLS